MAKDWDQTETQSLLHREEGSLSTSSSSSTLYSLSPPSPPATQKFPWRPVLVILALNTVVPLAFELVFPFVNQMILEIGVVDDPEKVGFYSGTIESIFAVMSFLCVVPFSYLSDHYGRKPVVLCATAILAVTTALFGFSKSYWFMIVTRSFGGICAGASWSTMKVMLGEITDKSNQGKAFAFFAVSYRTGQVIGQPIGGLLAHPERILYFFDTWFWREYPYALPCLFSGTCTLVTVVWGCYTLSETLPTKIRNHKREPSYGSISSEDTLSDLGDDGLRMKGCKKSPWRAVLTPHVRSLLLSLSTMVIASEILFALYPLFAFTPIESGGLGLSEAAIGAHMAFRAFSSIFSMLLFAPLQRHFGTVRTYQMAMSFWPLMIMFYPGLNFLARWGAPAYVMNGTLSVFFIIWGSASIAWPASSVMINDATPSADTLAAMNGISQMAIVLPQAIAPVFVTSTFAFSISSNILGGNLIWVILLAITCFAAVHCLTLKEPSHDWREISKVVNDERSDFP